MDQTLVSGVKQDKPIMGSPVSVVLYDSSN
jgi:hypothetical protein